MIDHDTLQEVMAIGAQRRAERRRFIKMAGGAAAAAGSLSLLSACGNDDDDVIPATPTPTGVVTPTANDVDILNFALTLEYLEASYYLFAAFGTGLNSTLVTGTGTQGTVTGGRAVTFADATVASYAREIAGDENAHVNFLRTQLGSSAVAMPNINIDGTTATGAFTLAARAAGVVTSTGTFDPYASDDNWLLGGMLLTDVGVTAYKGSASLINSATIIDAAAGILATEAYHSGLIRTLLYRRGLPTAPAATTATNDRSYSELISTARDSLDGTSDDDQGVTTPGTVTANGVSYASSNIVPTDANGIVYGRTAANVLNEVFLSKSAVTAGGFFPSGVNGNLKTSNAN